MPATATTVQHRIEGLDLLRGFAILLVLLRHSWPEPFGGAGIVGVVVFFTLSGYLITGLLVADLHRFGRVRYGRFYRNRAIRLLPPLAFLLIGFVIVEGIVDLLGTRDSVLRSVVVAVTYTMNIPFDHGSPTLSHLWTLANEEQFYLLWPLVLAVGLRYRKLKLLIGVAAVLLVLALVGSIVVAQPQVERIYTLPTTWTISMVIGAAAQLGQGRIDSVLTGKRVPIMAAVAVAALAAMSFIPESKSSIVMLTIGGAAVGVLTVFLIWLLRDIPSVRPPAKPLLWLGTISYAAYLWNYPVAYWAREVAPAVWPVLAVFATLAFAAVSWFTVERPFNALKSRLNRRARLTELDPVFAAEQGADAQLRGELSNQPVDNESSRSG